MKKGFTLIELVAVIAIIGILTVTVFTVINPVTQLQKGRDSKRSADLAQIRAALELYRSDNGSYPAGGWFSSDGGANWIPGLVPNYIKTLPVDPLNTGGAPYTSSTSYTYGYYSGVWCGASAGSSYILVARFENTQDPNLNKNITYGTCQWPNGAYTGLYTLTSP